MRWLRYSCLLGFLAGFVPVTTASIAEAAEIRYQAVDRADALGPGGDLWQYRYTVSGIPFEADQGFSIYFDPTQYGAIQDPPPFVSGDWDVLVLQPDTALPDPGLYDALALADDPSLAHEFVVDFVWLGLGRPGEQPFTINQFSAGGVFLGALDSGVTTPEPGTAVLVVLGLTFLGVRHRR